MSDLTERPRKELTATEAAQFEACETTIKAGLETFYEVGNALLAIRDARLYRRDFATFEDYCRQRWGMVASRARQLIGAAGVAMNLQGVTSVTLSNEAQARALAPLSSDKLQQVVWTLAVNTAPVVDGKPQITAPHIKNAAYTVELLEKYGWQGDAEPGRAFLIDPEFYDQMSSPDPYLFASMEASMLKLGIIKPLDVWGNTILDGHVRYFIAMRHNLHFEVTPRDFDSRSQAILFILETHLHRKNYTRDEMAAIQVDLDSYMAANPNG